MNTRVHNLDPESEIGLPQEPLPLSVGLELACARAAFDHSEQGCFFTRLLHQLSRLSDCEGLLYLELDGTTAGFSPRYYHHDIVQYDHLPAINDAIRRQVEQTHQPWYPEQLRLRPDYDQLYLALVLPIIAGERLQGILGVYTPAPHLIPADPACRLNLIGRMLGSHLAMESELELLRERELRLRNTVELAAIGIGHVSPGGYFIHANQQLCFMLGYRKNELVGKSVKEISHPDDCNLTDEEINRLHRGLIDSIKMEKRYIHKEGYALWVRLTIAVQRDRRGNPLHHISIVEDISERKQAEARVQYLATHDEMTGLPNRMLFKQMLKHSVDLGQRYSRAFSVMFVDLDRFKQVNDSLGHEAGDLLLVAIAGRLKSCVRSSDIVSRFGGDEFVILLEELSDKSQTANIAKTIISTVIKPVKIKGQDCRVTASIGIAAYPDHGTDAVTLIKNADTAMYLAKEDGKNSFRFYDHSAHSCAVEKLALESAIRRAWEENEFSIHYQAKNDTRTRQVCGAEALLRWNSRELGLVSPARFIPAAEEIGIIIQIGKWVISEVCRQIIRWRELGLPPICVAVNLSPRQFLDEDLIPFITGALQETGIDPTLLELEITESMVMHNLDRAVDKLKQLKALGLRIAIDDFGTGYSSLSQLKRFPVDTLKVDRSFIREVQNNRDDQAITTAIIAMGKTLGLTVVAEGVENEEQIRFLTEQHCDELQGFYFSKPEHTDAFTAHLDSQFRTYNMARLMPDA